MKLRLTLTLALGFMAMPMTAQATFWSLFNIEGETSISADYVTYATLADMLGDTNRTGVYTPNPFGFGQNIVGSGSDEMDTGISVPEPGTLVLFGFGLAGLGLARRRFNA
jgi:hypothetical protein